MIAYLFCFFCNKCVSSPFRPEETDTPDKGLILRAIVICPECIEAKKVIISNAS